jgi:hypothetical protein
VEALAALQSGGKKLPQHGNGGVAPHLGVFVSAGRSVLAFLTRKRPEFKSSASTASPGQGYSPCLSETLLSQLTRSAVCRVIIQLSSSAFRSPGQNEFGFEDTDVGGHWEVVRHTILRHRSAIGRKLP